MEDASTREGFVSLRADIVAVQLAVQWQPVEGGLAVTSTERPRSERVTAWRAGRTIEAPITFRRPTRYLNDGVPDFERDQALNGVTLLGTVKSGLLVDVVEPAESSLSWRREVRAHVRRAVGRWIEPHDSISGCHRIRCVDWRSHRAARRDSRSAAEAAGTYHVIAISGGNIAILAAAATFLLLTVGVRGRALPARPSSFSVSTRSSSRRAVRVARHVDGGLYFCGARDGPPQWRVADRYPSPRQ